MKIYFNSKVAKWFTFMKDFETIMLFGAVFTEKSYLDSKTIEHENTHCLQYWDCFRFGVSISASLMIGFIGLDVFSLWLLTLLLIPALLYYVWYGIEYLALRRKGYASKDAYRNISFEKHARWCAETWNKPFEQKNQYKQFGWMSYLE